MGDLRKFLLSPSGIVVLGVILLLFLLLIGKLFGASFFFMASITLGFLILLIVYLILHLFEGHVLQRFRKSLTKSED